MRLRSRILLLIAVSFTTLATLVVAINGALVTTRFAQLETQEVTDQLDRLRATLTDEATALANKISDWSSWDDPWRFVSGMNPTFVQDQITASSLSGNAIEVMLFLDLQGRVVHREAQAGSGGAARSEAMLALINATPALRPITADREAVVVGLISISDDLALYAARPILHSDGSGPAAGTLVWIRDLDAARLSGLAERLHSQVTLWPSARAPASVRASPTITRLNDHQVAGHATLRDALGQDGLIAQVVMPRRTWMAGMSTLWWQAISTVLALMATAVGALFTIDRLVVRRVLSLAAQTAAGDQDERRIHITGNDELANLARQVDALRDRLRQLHREAMNAADAKASFLATMSHEIRTPLNGVIGMIGLMSRTQLNREQREYADIIRSSADALLMLLNDILDFSKIEAGKMDLEHVPFRVANMLGDAAAVLAGRIQDKGVSLVLAFDPALPEVLVGDPGRLRQIVTNLVSNAAKFTERGSIVVRAQTTSAEDGLHLTVSVEDSGVGMEPATCARLFQAFTQAEASTNRKYGGTGLGLAICRRLVELMNGTIGVTSVPGRGSVFTFSVRVSADASLAPMSSPLSPKQNVLIACPQTDLRNWLIRTMSHWGGEPLAVGDAQTFALALNGAPPDLVVIDRALRLEDGSDPGERIHQLWPGIPLVMLALPDDRAAPAGTVVISKPVRIERLHTAITDARSGNVSLPVAEHDASPAHFHGRVLVVDDHPINRRLAEALLTRTGAQVLQAADGQQALDLLVHETVDLVLMDCQMPVLDGLEATQRLREREAPGQRLPVIALTANAFSDDRKRCLDAGMDGFLTKPLKDDELLATLSRYLPHDVEAARTALPPRAEPEITSTPSAPAVFEERSRAMLQGMPGTVAGTNLFDELTARFREEFPERFDALVADVIGELAPAAAQKAHALRGSTLTLGMVALGTVLSQLEEHARNNDLGGAVQLLGTIEEEWARVLAVLDHPERIPT